MYCTKQYTHPHPYPHKVHEISRTEAWVYACVGVCEKRMGSQPCSIAASPSSSSQPRPRRDRKKSPARPLGPIVAQVAVFVVGS